MVPRCPGSKTRGGEQGSPGVLGQRSLMGADVSVIQNNGQLWQPGGPCIPSWSVPCPVPPPAHGKQERPFPACSLTHLPASSCCFLAHFPPGVPGLSPPQGHGGSDRTQPFPTLLPSLHWECQATLTPAISCWPALSATNQGICVMLPVAREAAVLGCSVQSRPAW